MTKPTLINSLKRIVNKRGAEALERAKVDLCSGFSGEDSVSMALRYFAETALSNALPVFPALISLSCEAAGGRSDKIASIGANILLMAGAADIHDDVIDESPIKSSKRTVLGKFGKEVAILAGDVLLTRGLLQLQKECESISEEQRDRILLLLAKSIFDISRAEALETRMRATHDLSPVPYLDIIDLKSVVPELNMQIGAILGNGNADIVETLGHFGRTFGIVSTVAEEFMDVLEHRELENRIVNRCLPLPYLLALQNSSLRTRISPSKKGPLSKTRLDEIEREVLNSPEADELTKRMSRLVQNEMQKLAYQVEKCKASEELGVLLDSSLELLLSVKD